MTDRQKAAILVGLLPIVSEYTEDLIESGFGRIFTGTIKHDAKKMIRHLDNCGNKICAIADDGTNEQIFDVYSYLIDIINEIDWEGENQNKPKRDGLKKDS